MNRHLKDYLLLLKYRVYSAFHNWRVWTLFLLSILFTCMNMASFVFSNETYKDVSNNICYGYIAGFIFYLLNEFRTSTKQEFEDMAFISRAFHFILQNIDDLERQIMRGHAKPEDYNDCEQLLKESSVTESIVLAEYLKAVLDSHGFINTGGVTPQLTVPNLKSYRLFIPKDIEYQKTIITKIKEHEEMISMAEKQMSEIYINKQTILDKYLK